MRPPRRPVDDRRPERRDPRAAPPRDAKAPAPGDGGKPTRAARPTRGGPAAETRPERAVNARATRAARFRADHGGNEMREPARDDRPAAAKRARPGGIRPAHTVRPVSTDAAPGRPRSEKARPPRTADTKPPRSTGAKPPRAPRSVSDTPRAMPPRTTGARPGGTPAPVSRPAATARREPQRIAKLLARAGIASRREIERMIAEGRVAIDGKPLDTPATIITSLHGVTVDGQPVGAPTPARLFLFHKPVGFLTAERDPKGRPTIYDRLPRDLPRVMPVGRLDLNTEGLLLLTTDGELKRKLELPSSGIPRLYRARAYGEVSQQQLEALIEGVEIEGIRYGQIDANMERRTGRNVWIEMKITEGKNREVRRVLEYLGLQVSRLIRVAYGPFVLADLAPGGVVEVRQHDLVAFRQTLR